MNYFFSILFFVAIVGNAQDLNEIRKQYPLAVENTEIAEKLNDELTSITESSTPELQAYKGAVLTLKAKFAKSRKDKTEFFKRGVALIESAVEAASSNIEIRYIRMGVQENSPKFLGYHKNIEADKGFILKNYESISTLELKEIVKDFVLKSENFSENEKSGI